jgi:hypothetical protein
MTTATMMALIALIASIISAGFSIYFGTRDRARLHAFSHLYKGDDEHAPHIKVAAINKGRRPLILRMWGGADDKGEWVGTFIERERQGHRLGEHERFEITLENGDLGFELDEFDEVVEFTELWFEDSIGRRHRVNGSRQHIKEFWTAWRSFSSAQEKKRKMSSMIAREVQSALSKEAALKDDGDANSEVAS